MLGLVLLRGDEVVSLTIEGKPPADDRLARGQVAPVSHAACSVTHDESRNIRAMAGKSFPQLGSSPQLVAAALLQLSAQLRIRAVAAAIYVARICPPFWFWKMPYQDAAQVMIPCMTAA